MSTPRTSRKPKNPSRVFLAKFFGRPWREIERELRRRTPVEAGSVEAEVVETEATPQHAADEGDER